MSWDIIGDVHGEADALERLLEAMGYVEVDGAYRHEGGRRVVFLGDFIDRGPEQLRVIEIARRMMERSGALAVMGNHEFNAVGFATPDPEAPGAWMRPRIAKNVRQHRVFLEQVGGAEGALHRELVGWFKALPLWLDLGELRVVHACWHPREMEVARAHVDARGCLREAAWVPAFRRGEALYEALEAILKGVEMALPPGVTFADKEGHVRKRVRVAWWRSGEQTVREAALLDDATRAKLPTTPLALETIYTEEVPVFIGHYWLRGEPRPLAPNVACVDYSVAKGGHLVAYRWDGEALREEGFARVAAQG